MIIFFVANLALDRLIEKHRPELKSPHYKAERPFDLGSKYNLHNLITFNLIDKTINTILALPKAEYELKERFLFQLQPSIYRKYFKFTKITIWSLQSSDGTLDGWFWEGETYL